MSVAYIEYDKQIISFGHYGYNEYIDCHYVIEYTDWSSADLRSTLRRVYSRNPITRCIRHGGDNRVIHSSVFGHLGDIHNHLEKRSVRQPFDRKYSCEDESGIKPFVEMQ